MKKSWHQYSNRAAKPQRTGPDGFVYDSRTEMCRGIDLQMLERAGMETVAFCEIDSFCQKVLEKHWPDVPIYDDVRNLDYAGSVELICGGFPCQPFSVAGQQKGKEDDRHLWPAMFSLIKKHRPRWVIGENVGGFVAMALDDVLTDLESAGYECTTFIIPACAVGAPHRRDRVWIVGNSQHNGSSATTQRRKPNQTGNNHTQGQDKTSEFEGTGRRKNNENVAHTARADAQNAVQARGWRPGVTGSRSNVSDSNSERGRGGDTSRKDAADVGESSRCQGDNARRMEKWDVEPDVGRVAHGISNRMDRLKALGNAVVPQIPEILGRAIMEVERQYD